MGILEEKQMLKKVTNCFKSINSSSIEADAQNVTLSGQDQRNFLMNKLSRAPQTRVLVLRNMLKSDELDGEVIFDF